MSPGPTEANFRLCPRLRLCFIHLLRRPCRPFSRRGSFRLGPTVTERPLPASRRPAWSMVSIDHIFLYLQSHDQFPPRENRARLRAPRLLRSRPGPPSTQFLLCRSNTLLTRPHLLRLCLVPSLGRHLGVSAPQPPSPRRPQRQNSSSSSLSSGTRTPIGLANNAPKRFVKPTSHSFFLHVARSSPMISFLTWRLANGPHCRNCALELLNPVYTETTTAWSF